MQHFPRDGGCSKRQDGNLRLTFNGPDYLVSPLHFSLLVLKEGSQTARAPSSLLAAHARRITTNCTTVTTHALGDVVLQHSRKKPSQAASK